LVDRPQFSVWKVGLAIAETRKPHFLAIEERNTVRKLCQEYSHQNLVHVSFYGRLPDERWFIDMEFCNFSLRKYIREVGKRSKDEILPLPYWVTSDTLRTIQQDVWDIMRQISSGVAFMHHHNHIHRDIKPENSTQPLSMLVDSIILQTRFALEDWGFCSCFATLERS
jgi:serine/threonine protein kinase